MAATPPRASPPPQGTDVPPPSLAQQRVLDRIAVQRQRLRERRAALAQARQDAAAAGGIDESLVLRLAGFARQHPVAVAALAGAGVVAGPRRLIRWAGVLLPILMRLRR